MKHIEVSEFCESFILPRIPYTQGMVSLSQLKKEATNKSDEDILTKSSLSNKVTKNRVLDSYSSYIRFKHNKSKTSYVNLNYSNSEEVNDYFDTKYHKDLSRDDLSAVPLAHPIDPYLSYTTP